jgi:hypothetical protein
MSIMRSTSIVCDLPYTWHDNGIALDREEGGECEREMVRGGRKRRKRRSG